ncbi:hypothetical protein OROGR_009812 [Orobanche gracilis]
MGSSSGFHPPKFSEDDEWLPSWLQHCNFDQLNVDGIKKDHLMFEHRVEDLHFFKKGARVGESLTEGGCYVGQLFIPGTDSSPFSYAQSANNAVQFHLCLSSNGDSEDTDLTNGARQTKSNYITQPLEDSGVLDQEDVKLSLFHNAGAGNWSPVVELEKPIHKIELLKHTENVNLSEAAADVVELCIAASEALVINEVVERDTFSKSSSASAILEASLQVKQARLEVWKNTSSGSIHITSEVDNLSDLDDVTMESAFEDAGIHLSELPGNELSVSQVKDSFNSDYDENFKHEKTSTSATICGKSFNDSRASTMKGVIDNDIQLRKDFPSEYFNGDTQKKLNGNPLCALGTDISYQDHFLRIVDDHVELRLSVSAAERVDATAAENNFHETNMNSSPTMSCEGKDNNLPNIVNEQFKSRWFGGWTNDNEVKYTTVQRSIPKPFVCETSFLSESADAAPDENSFVQNHDKGAVIASQLSVPTENLYNRAMDEMLLSQDVRSSNTSLVDPLCSVVPCSIENICSSPAINYEKKVDPVHLDITTGIKTSKNGGPERFTSLRDYSKLSLDHTKISRIDCHQKDSFLMERNTESNFQENREETVKVAAEVSNKENTHIPSHLVNHRRESHFWASNSTDNEETSIRTALPENKYQCRLSDNLHPTLLQNRTQSAQKLRSSKRVHFCEKETKISDRKKLRKVQTTSKTCSSTRASKKSTRSSSRLECRACQIDRFPKSHLVKEKKRLIFQNMEFLLTGFSQKKEKEIEGLIRKYGGVVLSQLPSTSLKQMRRSRFKSRVLPLVLCLKKLHLELVGFPSGNLKEEKSSTTVFWTRIQSFKFLYGCAVNAYVLKVNWLNDSIEAGFVLPPKRYMILPRNISRRQDQVYTVVSYNTHSLLFNNLGVMLHGKPKYFTNIAAIIRHGGGQVFRTLQRLVQALEAGRISMGIVVVHEEICASRHLKHCALELNIPMMSVQWIIKSLYAGQLISLEEKNNSRPRPAIVPQRHRDSMELSQEI